MKRVSSDFVDIKQQRHICAIVDIKGKDFKIVTIGYNTEKCCMLQYILRKVYC